MKKRRKEQRIGFERETLTQKAEERQNELCVICIKLGVFFNAHALGTGMSCDFLHSTYIMYDIDYVHTYIHTYIPDPRNPDSPYIQIHNMYVSVCTMRAFIHNNIHIHIHIHTYMCMYMYHSQPLHTTYMQNILCLHNVVSCIHFDTTLELFEYLSHSFLFHLPKNPIVYFI